MAYQLKSAESATATRETIATAPQMGHALEAVKEYERGLRESAVMGKKIGMRPQPGVVMTHLR